MTTALHARIQDAFDATIDALLDVSRMVSGLERDPDISHSNLRLQGFLNADHTLTLINEPMTVHAILPTGTTAHHRISVQAHQARLQSEVDARHADLADHLGRLLTTMAEGPVGANTDYRPNVGVFFNSLGPSIAIGARVPSVKPVTVQGECWLPTQRDLAQRLICAATFNDTIGTGTPWTILYGGMGMHANNTHQHTSVRAPTPGDALQWAALLRTNSLLNRHAHSHQIMGVSPETVQASLDHAWERLGCLHHAPNPQRA